MKDTEAVAREAKEKEPKRPRDVRRLEMRKKLILDNLVLQFFELRSTIIDPEGEEAADLYGKYKNKWLTECKLHNKQRNPFKLRYEAFEEAVNFYLGMEKKQKAQTAEANRLLGFTHWFRRSHVGKTRPLLCLWYWIKALGKRAKWTEYWKGYYTKYVIQKV